MANVTWTAAEQCICEAVDQAFEAVQVPFLECLVNQPSHTGARDDVQAVAAIIDSMASELGLKRQLFPDAQGVYADHRVFSSAATRDTDRTLALVGHCDTVYPRSMGFLEMRRDPLSSASSGDHVFGPGVLDMKSGLTVILFALRALQQVDGTAYPALKLRFICNTDEEVGSPSSCHVFESLASLTTEALVFEAGRDQDQIVTARRGTGGFTLQVRGRAAHAGNEHAAGLNAIHVLALLIPQVEALTAYDKGTTVNVGMVQGGTAKNTVPDQAACQIDVRVSNLEQMQHVETRLRAIADWRFPGAEQIPARLREAQLELLGGIRRPPMETTPESDRLRQAYEMFAAKAGLGGGQAPMQGGGSDANNLAGLGVPTIDGLGPYGKYMHHPREWCSLDSLRRRTQALACFLASRC